ncbi:MAG TPA: NUDIX hydrolase [Bacteroidales bacterium]|jgi:8-oxo-dGTP diphosphatase|nr:NUDIX hydrolase [Bacteroidales bacterium]HOV55929.1 NUDIX hydrolase [Bacteroidales bacterium]
MYIKKRYCYDYPRPAVATDIIIIHKNKVLLVKRKNEPYKGMWSIPGGFNEENERLEDTAHRELLEETSLDINFLKQFKAYSDPKRDPRTRVISIVFYAILPEEYEINKAHAGDDAADLEWFNLSELPLLAFDHKIVLDEFIKFANL